MPDDRYIRVTDALDEWTDDETAPDWWLRHPLQRPSHRMRRASIYPGPGVPQFASSPRFRSRLPRRPVA